MRRATISETTSAPAATAERADATGRAQAVERFFDWLERLIKSDTPNAQPLRLEDANGNGMVDGADRRNPSEAPAPPAAVAKGVPAEAEIVVLGEAHLYTNPVRSQLQAIVEHNRDAHGRDTVVVKELPREFFGEAIEYLNDLSLRDYGSPLSDNAKDSFRREWEDAVDELARSVADERGGWSRWNPWRQASVDRATLLADGEQLLELRAAGASIYAGAGGPGSTDDSLERTVQLARAENPGAVVALLHDILMTSAIWVVLGLEFDLRILAAMLATAPALAQAPVSYDTTTVDGRPAVVVSEDRGGGVAHPTQGADVTWTRDYLWVLDGLVFVNENQSLRIQSGTVVKGKTGDGKNASALVVARGGQLFAEGTAEQPIIFTTVKDDLSTPDDLAPNFRGGWGGIIVMGRAPLNTTPTVLAVEGITANEIRNQYGGSDPDDSSGVLRYVSIRYGGTILEKGNEINGLTLAGVGRGTTVEYVEVYNNQDDGFEFFGGTVNPRYLVSAFTTDDSFDIDQGYRGTGQFWLAVQNSVYADHAGEHDGGESRYGGEDSTPYATPQVYNATYVGSGVDGSGSTALNLRDNFAGSYFNSVFMDGGTNAGLQVEDLASGEDSRERWLADELRHENNLWWNMGPDYDGSTTTFEDIIQLTRDDDGNLVGDGGTAFRDNLAQYLRDENNQLLSASPIASIDRNENGVITSFNPLAAGDADAAPAEPSVFGDVGGVNATYTPVDFYGAFGDTNWAAGWTLLSQSGALQ